MTRWLLTASFAIFVPCCFWILHRREVSQREKGLVTIGNKDVADGSASLKHLLAHIFGQSVHNSSCPPDLLSCLTNSSYARRCPSACENINALSELLQQGNDEDITAWLTKKLERAAMESSSTELATTLAGHDHMQACGPCPHISCCVAYPSTVAQALLMRSGLLATPEQPTSAIFEELANQKIKSLIPIVKSNPFGFYNSTIKYYGEGCSRIDLGWVNEFLGTIKTYSAKKDAGVHAYRKVPLLADGKLDFNFSTTQLPKPAGGRPLVIGLLADWGCGNDGARRVIEELKKQQPDILLHLGDTYYSGTKAEQMELFLGLAREHLGRDVPILNIPGNHDYYSDGSGFMHLIDELAKTQAPKQEASFVALRGDAWQIIMLDTGILDSFQLNELSGALPLGNRWKKMNKATLAFLPDDQLEWALKQIEIGKAKGLKTMVMTHHQLFTRAGTMGVANSGTRELAFSFDVRAGVYQTSQWEKSSSDLPGQLPPDVQPAANTRLLDQFPAQVLGDVSAWFWGHEHASSIFAPYAGLQKGRLLGNACILVPKPPLHDSYQANNATDGRPWGGHPKVMENSKVGTGHNFLNLGFATITLSGSRAHAKYFEMEDYEDGDVTNWKDARVFYEEEL